VGTISGTASGSCDSCEGNFLRAVPDATKQSCEVDSIQMLLLAASALASTGFCFLCLTGFLGNATIADVSAQGQKVVMTTTLSHFLLKRSQVTFTGTGNPNLEGQSWTVQALNSFQLTLQVEGSDLDQLDTPWDVCISSAQVLLSTRVCGVVLSFFGACFSGLPAHAP